MGRKKKIFPVFEHATVVDAGAEGNAVARVGEKVVFVPLVAPGDVIDIKVRKKRKSFLFGEAIRIHTYSDKRVEPACRHFGQCGGCKWQHMGYSHQLFYKQKQVEESLRRLGKFEIPEVKPILGSQKEFFYRNKLEYTFSSRKWLTEYNKDLDFGEQDMDGLGFHMPGMFDRILDIEECLLQESPSNEIRLAAKKIAKELELSFYDVKSWTGFLRNILIRSASTGDLMVILVVNYEDQDAVASFLDRLAEAFPAITSLMYVVNTKKNSIITDLDIQLYRGEPFIMEEMEDLKFKVGPVSFYQTNSSQAYELYKVVREFAALTGQERVYDLYTGTGTIANFIARNAAEVVGVEYVEAAIQDARQNATLNSIENCHFVAGDISAVLTGTFEQQYGKPDVVITDPPRAGMHPDVVKRIVELAPERIVYVSCNPATQARDVSLLDAHYRVEAVQPVDMFPHTHHVENVMKLVRR